MRGKKEKAFRNCRHNSIHLTFPNGNSISTIWGNGSYSDNHDNDEVENLIDRSNRFMDSDTCEIMILKAPDELIKKIHKKFDGDGSVIGYLTMAEWLEVVKLLSNPKAHERK